MKGASPVYIIQHFVSFGKQIDRGFGKFSLINETSNYIISSLTVVASKKLERPCFIGDFKLFLCSIK